MLNLGHPFVYNAEEPSYHCRCRRGQVTYNPAGQDPASSRFADSLEYTRLSRPSSGSGGSDRSSSISRSARRTFAIATSQIDSISSLISPPSTSSGWSSHSTSSSSSANSAATIDTLTDAPRSPSPVSGPTATPQNGRLEDWTISPIEVTIKMRPLIELLVGIRFSSYANHHRLYPSENTLSPELTTPIVARLAMLTNSL